MAVLTKLGAYALGLLIVFVGAAGLGKVAGPHAVAALEPAHGHGSSGAHSAAAAPPGGLQSTEDGYRIRPVTAGLAAGGRTDFAFQIIGPDGAPVTRYTPAHERDLHLIVVRRDLSGFQHVHPTLGGDGTWRIPLTVPAAGQYRVFTDFQPAGAVHTAEFTAVAREAS